MMLVCLVLIVVWFACMCYLDDDSCGEIGDQKMVLIIGIIGYSKKKSRDNYAILLIIRQATLLLISLVLLFYLCMFYLLFIKIALFTIC